MQSGSPKPLGEGAGTVAEEVGRKAKRNECRARHADEPARLLREAVTTARVPSGAAWNVFSIVVMVLVLRTGHTQAGCR